MSASGPGTYRVFERLLCMVFAWYRFVYWFLEVVKPQGPGLGFG